jgi:hypothetical protein
MGRFGLVVAGLAAAVTAAPQQLWINATSSTKVSIFN